MAEIDQAALGRAREALAAYHNEGRPEGIERVTPEMFADYQVMAYEEWLVFASPGGYTNQLFMVNDGTVYEFPGSETYDVALEKARALKAQQDG